MRVLLISPQPFFAERGTPIAVKRLAETLCADGHTVDLLTFPFGEDVPMDRLTIIRCPRFPGVRGVKIGFSIAKLLQDVLLTWKLWRLARPGRYDVVHAVEESVYPALLLRWRHRGSVIYDMDSSLAEQMAGTNWAFRLLHPLMKRIERWAIQSVDLVVPMCPDLAQYAATARESHDIVVLHDVPMDTPEATDVDSPWEAQTDDRRLALYVGNLESYQGIDLLVEAVARLPADSPVRVVVVGGAKADVERYRSEISERGLGRLIHFVGARPLEELKSLLARADFLVSPRIRGTNTPLKLYSYMDSGRAILATRLKTHTQVLDDTTALLVEPDPESLALGLLRLARHPDLSKALAQAAKRRVSRHYSLDSFSRRVRHIYPRSLAPMFTTVDGLNMLRAADPMWGRSCRRTVQDRRRGSDRRSLPRARPDRRVSVRRAPVFAGSFALG